MRVKVYRNLKHGRKALPLYSIMDMTSGKVIDRRHEVQLMDVVFKVSEAGRKRVVEEQRKNVHAFVIGTLAPPGFDLGDSIVQRVSYNPYTMTQFQVQDRAVRTAQAVQLNATGLWALNPKETV